MKFVNRFLMLPFCLTLLLGVIYNDFLFVSALIAFVVGVFQLLSSLTTLFYFYKLEKNIRKYISIYLSLVIIYFVSFFALIDVLNQHDLKTTMYIIPVFLSIFWTYILEYKKEEL